MQSLSRVAFCRDIPSHELSGFLTLDFEIPIPGISGFSIQLKIKNSGFGIPKKSYPGANSGLYHIVYMQLPYVVCSRSEFFENCRLQPVKNFLETLHLNYFLSLKLNHLVRKCGYDNDERAQAQASVERCHRRQPLQILFRIRSAYLFVLYYTFSMVTLFSKNRK